MATWADGGAVREDDLEGLPPDSAGRGYTTRYRWGVTGRGRPRVVVQIIRGRSVVGEGRAVVHPRLNGVGMTRVLIDPDFPTDPFHRAVYATVNRVLRVRYPDVSWFYIPWV